MIWRQEKSSQWLSAQCVYVNRNVGGLEQTHAHTAKHEIRMRRYCLIIDRCGKVERATNVKYWIFRCRKYEQLYLVAFQHYVAVLDLFKREIASANRFKSTNTQCKSISYYKCWKFCAKFQIQQCFLYHFARQHFVDRVRREQKSGKARERATWSYACNYPLQIFEWRISWISFISVLYALYCSFAFLKSNFHLDTWATCTTFI